MKTFPFLANIKRNKIEFKMENKIKTFDFISAIDYDENIFQLRQNLTSTLSNPNC